MTFEQFKARFDSEVNSSHITVDWDAGHCYSGINHPLHNVYNLDMSDDDIDEAEQYACDWLGENEPALYCVPSLINELCGDCVVADECWGYNTTGEERLDHVKGFIHLVEQYNPTGVEWYHIAELKEWVIKQELIAFLHKL